MTPKSIFVVEDEGIVAADIQDRLNSLGYRVAGLAASGEEALAKLPDSRTDLVLMDIVLRGKLDGIDTAAVITQDLNIPVVFLTAHADVPTLSRAKITAPLGYILKPFAERELHTAIEIALHRQQLESTLKQAQRLLSATLASIGEGVITTDTRPAVTFLNRVAETLTARSLESVLDRELDSVFGMDGGDPERAPAAVLGRVLRSGRTESLDFHVLPPVAPVEGRFLEGTCAPIRDEHGSINGAILVFRDVSERRQAQAERERLIGELQEALSNVKILRGLLPICAWCKRVRDDRGYWEMVEVYIRNHTEARFTHGICPECLAKERATFSR